MTQKEYQTIAKEIIYLHEIYDLPLTYVNSILGILQAVKNNDINSTRLHPNYLPPAKIQEYEP